MPKFLFVLLIIATGCREQSAAPGSSLPMPSAPVQPNTPASAGETVSVPSSSEMPADSTASITPAVPETDSIDVALKPLTVLDGKLSLLVPEAFTEMSDEMLQAKYPREQRPTLVYTNETGTVNIAFNFTKNRITENQIGDFHKQMDVLFHKLQPTATWFDSKVTDIQGRNWLMLDFRSQAVDTEIRNMTVGTSVEGRLLLVSFNVTKELEDQWLKTGKAMIQSLHVIQ